MRDESDENLMLRYRDGDAGAFDVLYQRHKGPLYRYLKRMLDQDSTTDEIYQDVWMRVIQARERYQATAAFRTYLFQIAHNRALDYFRAHQRQPVHESIDESPDGDVADGEQLDVSELVHNQSCAQHLLLLIQRLPVAQRQVFLLKEEAGLSTAEIAGLTMDNVEAVKSRLRYAIAKLRTGLREFVT